ncbi:acyl-CoA dehydrogenase family protein [Chryseolinea sp. H1M3-3]|uniref:acyl-CoA dehydrogenase family protein n=1 Tax=Chryseolinea sp. H1M3-3 TaxID=3034144 RepID=UPI0023ECB233|nr:acyl-CoA dehydrogenase family protein [Chryseolinea sp. H1M3-3]
METMTQTLTNWKELTHELGKSFEARAEQHDKDGKFVFQNYDELKKHKYFSAAIPEELGGGGASHSEMCDIIRIMAKYCGSTALAFSMHQHLVAAAVWRYKHKGEAVAMLQKVAKDQLVLVSTGARDWLDSNGEMIKTDDGYLLSGKKHFASQSIAGDLAVTSAPHLHPENGWQVLHFAVPLKAKGVSVLDDWDTMGMRATGSQTIVFDQVLIPETAIVLARPRNGYHPVWDIVLTVAMPLIMSAYVGIAEKAKELALSIGKKYQRQQPHLPYIIGKMNNTFLSARVQWEAMTKLTNDIDFKPSSAITVDIVSLKTNVASACIETVQQAMEATGGQSFYRKNLLERLFRDVQGAQFHPIPKWDQYVFTGERLIQNV